ncbi:hypothetical protein ONS95_000178 [Cadophora gregata]|uniref:uncharacterized protein n=1 Tax=Cadophora gregata TaxID=51156 RepID=UPI0026DAE01A|nr:uncharacterized protein ONS95_000178 [Cadophora gregata]KAK0115545.1 hypothetical protein ONS96_013998 [Cadophora gregata f. sp. sojae]KAK0128200.1 hypothetical protein ONS95_000178 [Cadophora gregata]
MSNAMEMTLRLRANRRESDSQRASAGSERASHHEDDSQRASEIKLSISSFSLPVKVIVGPEKVEMWVQKGIICDASGFFKAACNEKWESGRTNTVTLSREKPAIFAIFATWLLTGDITNFESFVQDMNFFSGGGDDNTSDPETYRDVERHNLKMDHLFDSYILGDFLMAPAFKETIMDHLFEYSRGYAVAELISFRFNINPVRLNEIYDATGEDSPLRRFIIDKLIGTFDSPAFTTFIGLEQLNREVLSDVATAFFEVGVMDGAWFQHQFSRRARCAYQENPTPGERLAWE